MDKKNTLLGVICIAAGLCYMFWQAKELEKQGALQSAEETVVDNYDDTGAPADAIMSGTDSKVSESADDMIDLFAKDVISAKSDEIIDTRPVEIKAVQLSNDFIEVNLTSRGGAIDTVAFLQTKRGGRDEYVFNEGGILPALSLSLALPTQGMKEFSLPYEIEKQTNTSVTFVYQHKDGFIIRRSYELAQDEASGQDPYTIRHRTTFENKNDVPKSLSTVYFNLGSALPISEKPQPNFLNVGYFDGEDAEFIAVNKLIGSAGFLGIGANLPKDEIELPVRAQWTSVKNQFFAAVLSSSKVSKDLFVYPVQPEAKGMDKIPHAGISGSVGYAVGTLGAGNSESFDFDFYIGPKEFKRLQGMGNGQDEVMQFGFLHIISKLLLSFMYLIHSIVPSWGWSIVIMTICIKTLFWPLSAKASRSQKRMAKIQGPMAEMKEKYKDNPQKMQQETLKLFREHKVNPVAGCLPMLIQMPIFLGLFYMLRTASELRHEQFLWVSDLSQPDTLMYVAGFPINLLPLIMGITMFLQMRMMPVSPTADPAQQKIFKFLPFVFLIFLYGFSSGLVLYWTVQNILTIIQQKIINNLPDEELTPATAAPKGASKGKGGASRTKKKR